MATETRTASVSRTDSSDSVYSFEDIERYAYVIHTGRPAYVVAKGEDVCPNVRGRHIKLEFADGTPMLQTDTIEIRENLVNRYLRDKRMMFVDFNGYVEPMGGPDEQ